MTLMRVTDVFLSVPPLVLALSVSVALEASLTNSMLAIAAVWWPWYARLTYGEVLSVKKETYVEASRGIGATSARTIFRDILPNVLAPITVKMSLDMGYAILVASALRFLGLGHSRRRPSGDDGQPGTGLHARPVVVLDVPGSRHLPHRPRVQLPR